MSNYPRPVFPHHPQSMTYVVDRWYELVPLSTPLSPEGGVVVGGGVVIAPHARCGLGGVVLTVQAVAKTLGCIVRIPGGCTTYNRKLTYYMWWRSKYVIFSAHKRFIVYSSVYLIWSYFKLSITYCFVFGFF